VLPREIAEQEQDWHDLIRREIGALGRLGKFMVILGLEVGENKGSKVRVVYIVGSESNMWRARATLK
jgi:hypothetical protein